MPLYKIGLREVTEVNADIVVLAENESEAMAVAKKMNRECDAFADAIQDQYLKAQSRVIVEQPVELRHPSDTTWAGDASSYGKAPNNERHLAAVFYGLDEPKEVEGQKADKEWAAYRREAKKLAARFNREKKTKPAK